VNAKRPALTATFLVGIFALASCPARSESSEAAGAVLYRDKGCARCHGANGEGTLKAPALAEIRKNKMWTPDKITRQILDGGPKMPPFSDALSNAEVGQLVSFLRSRRWPVPPKNPAP
jgi:mono/diheme cytochrome c family protein